MYCQSFPELVQSNLTVLFESKVSGAKPSNYITILFIADGIVEKSECVVRVEYNMLYDLFKAFVYTD